MTIHTLSSDEVKGTAELHLCSPSGPSWVLLGETLHLHFYFHFTDTCGPLHPLPSPLTPDVQLFITKYKNVSLQVKETPNRDNGQFRELRNSALD